MAAPSGQRTVSRTPPAICSCLSSVSVTISRLETRTSIRCVGCGAGAVSSGTLSFRFCSASPRTAPASTTVPSTLRRSPSESEARAGAGAGCGSISAHQAPSRHHRVARGNQATRWARMAATQHRTATGARATNTNPGRSQTQCVTAIPAAKSHAAWNRGAALRPEDGCPEVGDSDCIGPDKLKELWGPA